MIDIKTGKEMTRRDFIGGGIAAASMVGLAGSANATVRRGLGARLAANFSQGTDEEEEMYKEILFARLQNTEWTEEITLPITKLWTAAFTGWSNFTGKLHLDNVTTFNSSSQAYVFGTSGFIMHMQELTMNSLRSTGTYLFGFCAIDRLYLNSCTTIGDRTFWSLSGPCEMFLPMMTSQYVATRFNTPNAYMFQSVRDEHKSATIAHCSDGTVTWDGSTWVANPA